MEAETNTRSSMNLDKTRTKETPSLMQEPSASSSRRCSVAASSLQSSSKVKRRRKEPKAEQENAAKRNFSDKIALNPLFPGFRQQNLPFITSKILLHVNYHDDLRRFRLVSRGFRDFIDQEILANPSIKKTLLRKKFVHDWTNKTPRREKVDLGRMLRTDRFRGSYISGDYIFISYSTTVEFLPTYGGSVKVPEVKTLVYKGLKHIGTVSTRKLPLLVPYKEEGFINLHDTSSVRIYYRKDNDEITDDAILSSSPFNDSVDFSTLREERHRLGLVCIDDKLLLIYVDKFTGSLILSNLVDDTEKVIVLSKIGVHRKLSAVNIIVDGRELLIFWKREDMLQLINHIDGVELWADYGLVLPGALYHNKVAYKTAELSCILCQLESGPATVQFFSNATGHLVTCYTTWDVLQVHSRFVVKVPSYFLISGPVAVWSEPGNINIYHISKGSLKTKTVRKMTPCNECHFSPVELLGLVKGRILLAKYECDDNACRRRRDMPRLMAFDLLDEEDHGPFILDSRIYCSYIADVHRGKVVSYNCKDELQILDFTS